MTVTNSFFSFFVSHDRLFIGINGLRIFNDRDYGDRTHIDGSYWSDILVGTDGYPKRCQCGEYFIAGGDEDCNFKATAIEFYGVKTQT